MDAETILRNKLSVLQKEKEEKEKLRDDALNEYCLNYERVKQIDILCDELSKMLEEVSNASINADSMSKYKIVPVSDKHPNMNHVDYTTCSDNNAVNNTGLATASIDPNKGTMIIESKKKRIIG